MFKRILVATDGSKLSDKAVKTAIALAKSTGAHLTAFYAATEYKTPYFAEGTYFDWPTTTEFKKRVGESATKMLNKIVKAADDADVDADTFFVFNDRKHEAIIEQAKKSKVDLIVMASHGRRAVSSLFIGSETQKVLAFSKIPVLVVR
jgi:nucleotide-binding universal stress UspA family protein